MTEYDEEEKKAYKTLKLPDGASRAEIKKQRDELAREFHSDVNAAGNEDELKEINNAYEKLTNPAQIKARERAKRRAAAEKAKAEAARRAAEAKAKAAREQRERSIKESEVFGERLRGQAGGTKASPPKAPPSTPTPSPSAPPPSSSPGQNQIPTSAPSLWRVAFLAVPIGIMALVIPANNAHPSAFLDVISIVCFFGLIAGIAGIFIEW